MIVASKKFDGILDNGIDLSRDSSVAFVVINLSPLTLGPQQCERARYWPFSPFIGSTSLGSSGWSFGWTSISLVGRSLLSIGGHVALLCFVTQS